MSQTRLYKRNQYAMVINITAPKLKNLKEKTAKRVKALGRRLPCKAEKSRKPRKGVIKPEQENTTPRAKERANRDLRPPETFWAKKRFRFLLHITAFPFEQELSLNLHRSVHMQTPHHLCNKTWPAFQYPTWIEILFTVWLAYLYG